MKPFSIAIDGPAGSGKTTVSGIISKRLGILHLDTGAMYRALAYKALKAGLDVNDVEQLKPMLSSTRLNVEFDSNSSQRVILDGTDVMDKIRTSAVSKAASDIAVHPEVRLMLVELQRNIAREISLVIDGRDIGSYVLPDSPFKFYITADPRERAKRRLLELQARGLDVDKTLDEMTDEINARDKTDSTREFAPLTRAEDAVYIDTTALTVDEVADIIINRVRDGCKKTD